MSVWERPPELYGRPDVDKLVAEPPKVSADTKNADGDSDTSTTDDEEEEEEVKEPPTKKAKRQAAIAAALAEKKAQLAKQAAAEKAEEKEKKAEAAALVVPAKADPAIEAEIKAAQERANIPLEERMASFKTMLLEKQVSAFSTWEKELHKIVFDNRYLLLNSKERKQVFEEYVKERVDAERSERKKKAKESKEKFRSLLESLPELNPKSSFRDFEKKYVRDERFRALEKSKDREAAFSEYISEMKAKEKEVKREKREKQRAAFNELLKEHTEELKMHRHSHWSDVKKKLDSDERYKDIESSTQREDWFRDYIRTLPSEKREEKKKEEHKDRDHKDKDRSDRDHKDRHRDSSSRRDKDKDRRDSDRDKDKSRDRKDSDRDSKHHKSDRKDKDKERDQEKHSEEKKTEKSSWLSEPKDESESGDKKSEHDESNVEFKDKEKTSDFVPPQVKSLEDGEVAAGDHSGSEKEESDHEEAERAARAERAQREREKEVKRELSGLNKERDKELEKHKVQQQKDAFEALLLDLVKQPDVSWRDARKLMKKDDRYELTDLVDVESKERMFKDHIKELDKKRTEMFRNMLKDVAEIGLTASWRDAKKILKNDERFSKLFSGSDRRLEKEFREYMTYKLEKAKEEFTELLLETKIITYKSKKTIAENEQHLKDILSVLENDKRYLVLNCAAEQRERLLERYLDELADKGTPPPPTQSEPNRKPRRP